MANQVHVSLAFTADTQKARTQLIELQKNLTQLTKTAPNDFFSDKSTKEIIAAQGAVAKLQVALKEATNVDTGKLNLTKFNTSLKQSGMTLQQYRKQLETLGSQGEKAFLGLTKSIMTADVAVKNSNRMLDSFWRTLKQTAKFQFSGSIYRGLTAGIRSAFEYAKDLNESLNNIQIVTGKNADEMARFAEQANKAAKNLSTTTTAYTDAALIYYQQGDSEDLVNKKAEITLKAANAAGSGAKEMSEYLTAVWNSYKVGATELEKYVDIMAKLGAETASSLQEIATSMEKVASVGQSVGVEFSQLSSIISTVTSATRESPETVGTAYKTILARMADLELEGSIEEDGVTTTLGDVSSKLKSVGIDILDTNGDLRDMGIVLEELMYKWDSMNGAMQQAVAIAIAGKRQYNSLLALMNNQDEYFEAVEIANASEGTLGKQAEIYAKSWEASSKRVKAAAEGIWDSLISDDWFISLNDGFAVVLSGIENLVDALGGPVGVISGLGLFFTKIFNQQITASIARATESLYSMSIAGKQAADSTRQLAYDESMKMLNSVTGGYLNAEDSAVLATSKMRLQLQNELAQKSSQLTEQQIKQRQIELDINKAYEDRLIRAAQVIDQTRQELELSHQRAFDDIALNSTSSSMQKINTQDYVQAYQELKAYAGEAGDAIRKAFNGVDISGIKGLDNIIQTLDSVEVNSEEAKNMLAALREEASRAKSSGAEGAYGILQQKIQALLQPTQTARENFIQMAVACGVSEDAARRVADGLFNLGQAEQEGNKRNQEYILSIEELRTSLEKTATTGFQNFAKGVTTTLSGMSSLTMGISSFRGAWNALTNPDMSTFEKVLSIFSSLSMGTISVIHGLSNLTTGWASLTQGVSNGVNALSQAVVVQALETATTVVSKEANEEEARTISEVTGATVAETAAKKAENIVNTLSLSQKLALIAASKLGVKLKYDEAAGTWVATTAEGANNIQRGIAIALEAILNKSMAARIAIVLGLAAAIGLLVGAIILLVKWYQDMYRNSIDGQLESARKRSEELKKELERTTEASKKLKESFDKYKSAIEKIKDLTKGTKEWKEALKEVNASAIDIINSFSNIDGQAIKDLYYRDQSGMIVLNEDVVDKQQKKIDTATENVNYALDLNQIRIEQLSQMSELKSEILKAGIFGSANGSALTEDDMAKMIYAEIGSFQNLTTEEIQKKINELGLVFSLSAEKTQAFIESLRNISEQADGTAEKLNLISQIKIDEVLGDSFDAGVKGIVSKQMSLNQDDIYTKLEKKYTGWGISRASAKANNIVSDMLKQYNEATGSNLTLDSNAVRGGDNNRSFAFRDENGQEIVLTADVVASTIAAAEAMKGLDEAAKKVEQTLKKLETSGNSYDQALKKFLTDQNFSNISTIEFEDLQAEMKGYDTTEEFLNTKFGGEDEVLSDEEAQALGFTSAQDMVVKFNIQFENIEDEVRKVKAQWKKLGGIDAVEIEGIKDTSIELQKKVSNIMTGELAKNGGAAFEEVVNALTDGLKEDEFQEALGALTQVDWSSWDSVEEAVSVMNDLGFETDLTATEMDILADKVREASGANPDFEKMISNLQSIAAATKDIEFGKIFSEEDYQKLMDAGYSAENFMKSIYGGYKYVGYQSGEDILKDQYQKDFKEMEDAYEKYLTGKKNAPEKLRNYSYEEILDEFETESLFYSLWTGNNRFSITNALLELSDETLSIIGLTKEEIENWDYDEMLENSKLAIEQLQKLKDETIEESDEYQGFFKLQESIASTANSVEELNQLWDDGLITLDKVYEKALRALDPQVRETEELKNLFDNFNETKSFDDEGNINIDNPFKEWWGKTFNIDFTTNTDAIVKQLDDVFEKEREISVAIEGDINSDIAMIQKSMQGFEQAGSMINESWQVAPENIATVAKMFPGILEAYTVTSTGMIQLDRDKAQAAIQAAVTEQQANIETAKQKIEIEKVFVQAKINALKEALVAAENFNADEVKTEADFEDLKAKMVQAYSTYSSKIEMANEERVRSYKEVLGIEEENIDNEVANTEEQNSKDVAETAIKSSKVQLDANKQMTEGVIRNANLIAEALRKAFEGKEVNVEEMISQLVGSSAVIATAPDAKKREEKKADENAFEQAIKNIEDFDPTEYFEKGYNPTEEDWNALAQGMMSTYIDGLKKSLNAEENKLSGLNTQMAQIEGIGNKTQNFVTNPSGSTEDKNNSDKSGKDSKDASDKSDLEGEEEKERSNEAEQVADEIRDIVERLADVNTELEKNQRLLDGINRIKDEAVGTAYIQALKDENDAIRQGNELLTEKMRQAKKWGEIDKEELASLGVPVEFDSEGNIKNLEDVQRWIGQQKLAAAQAYDNAINSENASYVAATQNLANIANAEIDAQNAIANSAGDDEAAKEAAKNAADAAKDKYDTDLENQKAAHEANKTSIEQGYEAEKKKYDRMEDLLDSYNNMQKDYFDAEKEREENLMQIRENNADMISKKLEFQNQLIEDRVGLLELENELMGEGYEKATEVFANMSRLNDSTLLNMQNYLQAYQDSLTADISQARREEIIRESMEGISDSISEMYDRFTEQSEAWGKALDGVMEDLEEINKQYDTLISSLETYEDLLGLLGEENPDNAKLLSSLYDSQASISLDQYEASRQTFDMAYQQMLERKAAYDAASTEEEKKLLEDSYKAAKETASQTYTEMLSYAKTYADKLQKVRDQALAQSQRDYERKLFGTFGLDAVLDEMDHLKAMQENYLTDTNQQYETQKMIRTAMLAIENTENEVAKRKLKQFQAETKELQEQGKLSKFELEVQQAKYEMLLAEIALQEAQNTLSQVRLTRDAQGNFNYVYTADQDKVSEAQQKFADAENALYNIRLEGANNFREQYVTILQDALDKIVEIQTDETISEEEKAIRVSEIRNNLYEQLESMQSLYNIASMELGDELEEAWSSNMENNIASAGEFKTYTSQYLKETGSAFSDYEKEVKKLSENIAGDDPEAYFTKMEKASQDLTNQMLDMARDGGYYLSALGTATEKWADKAGAQIRSITRYWQEQLETMRAVIETQNGYSAETNWARVADTSNSITGTYDAFVNREEKYTINDWYRQQYGDNEEIFFDEVRNQHQQMIDARGDTMAMLKAAARREGKILWAQDFGSDSLKSRVGDILSEQGTTASLIAQMAHANGMIKEGETLGDAMARWTSGLTDADMIKDMQYWASEMVEQNLITLQEQQAILAATGQSYGNYLNLEGIKPEKTQSVNSANILAKVDPNTDVVIDNFDELMNNVEFNAFMTGLQELFAPMLNDNTGEALEQNVTITAEFPNVQSSFEIEEAFKQIINNAAQYANRKNQ